MSCKPHPFAAWLPTGLVFSKFGPLLALPYGETPLKFACMVLKLSP